MKILPGLRLPKSLASPTPSLSAKYVGLDLYQCLKPVDRLVLSYLVITTPLLCIATQPSDVILSSLLVRLLLIPSTLGLRYFLATRLPGEDVCKHRAFFGTRQITLNPSRLAVIWVDIYPLVTCIYLYAEDGKIIHNLYHGLWFFDELWHHLDYIWFRVDPNMGIGQQLREGTSENFNLWFGEYMHFCYFAFYGVLGLTWPMVWLFCPHEHFDCTATVVTLTYLVCLGTYLVLPTKGPFWTYSPPDPARVGWFFSHVTHAIDKASSSRGTAMPSAHCALTVANWLCSLLYLWPLAVVYTLVVPGVIVATMWCGFHYGVDTLFGVILGVLCFLGGVWYTRSSTYCTPLCDDMYSHDPSLIGSLSATSPRDLEANDWSQETDRHGNTIPLRVAYTAVPSSEDQ